MGIMVIRVSIQGWPGDGAGLLGIMVSRISLSGRYVWGSGSGISKVMTIKINRQK